MHVNYNGEPIKTNWASYLKWCYIVGLVAPILDWIFIFFLIRRVSEVKNKRSLSNPNFLETDTDTMDDYDQLAIDQHSGEVRPIFFGDESKDYSRPATNR